MWHRQTRRARAMAIVLKSNIHTVRQGRLRLAMMSMPLALVGQHKNLAAEAKRHALDDGGLRGW